jgi:hypothetical protein
MKLKLDDNFCDLLSAFSAHSVQYVIIGGWAVSIHAQPRATQDMDIFVSGNPANIQADCWARRVEVPVNPEGLSANFISAEDLIAAKLASGRDQDIADARAIQRAQQKKSS